MTNNIKQRRLAKHLKQEDLAMVIHKSVPNYCQKENGQLEFSIEEALVLARFFKTRVDKIFLLDESQ